MISTVQHIAADHALNRHYADKHADVVSRVFAAFENPSASLNGHTGVFLLTHVIDTRANHKSETVNWSYFDHKTPVTAASFLETISPREARDSQQVFLTFSKETLAENDVAIGCSVQSYQPLLNVFKNNGPQPTQIRSLLDETLNTIVLFDENRITPVRTADVITVMRGGLYLSFED